MNLQKTVTKTALNIYKSQKQKASDTSLTHCLEVACQTAQNSKYAFLTTYGRSHWPSTRLIQPIFDQDDFTFWIGTHPNLRKVAEIKANPHVTLAYGNEREDANLIIYGIATLITTPAQRRKYWKGTWRLFFPNGPMSAEYLLIKIAPQQMELMNFKRNITPEPFGLRPAKLQREGQTWTIVNNEVSQ